MSTFTRFLDAHRSWIASPLRDARLTEYIKAATELDEQIDRVEKTIATTLLQIDEYSQHARVLRLFFAPRYASQDFAAGDHTRKEEEQERKKLEEQAIEFCMKNKPNLKSAARLIETSLPGIGLDSSSVSAFARDARALQEANDDYDKHIVGALKTVAERNQAYSMYIQDPNTMAVKSKDLQPAFLAGARKAIVQAEEQLLQKLKQKETMLTKLLTVDLREDLLHVQTNLVDAKKYLAELKIDLDNYVLESSPPIRGQKLSVIFMIARKVVAELRPELAKGMPAPKHP